MGVILRIDVDNPYGWQSFGKKTLNYLRLNWGFPAIKKLGFLKFLDILVDDLGERSVQASFFFTTITTPKNLEAYKRHEVGVHLVSAQSFNEFLRELNQISEKTHREIRGFTKHGSGKIKLCRTHAPEYKQEKYIDWAQKANLKYFLGNGENPKEKQFFAGNVLIYPSAFWMSKDRRADKYDVDWLVKETKNRDIVVLLHPYNWATSPQIRKDYEKIMDKIDTFKTVREISEEIT